MNYKVELSTATDRAVAVDHATKLGYTGSIFTAGTPLYLYLNETNSTMRGNNDAVEFFASSYRRITVRHFLTRTEIGEKVKDDEPLRFGDEAMVRDDLGALPCTAIFLYFDPRPGIEHPYACVQRGHEDAFKNGEIYKIVHWEYCEKTPKIEISVKIDSAPASLSDIPRDKLLELWEAAHEQKRKG